MSAICLKLFYVLILVRLGYWVFLFSRLLIAKKATDSTSNPHSIIVCVKNGSKYFSNLSLFGEQNGEGEFIIVDDFSDIETKSKLTDVDSSIRVIHAEKDIAGKKNALSTGIKQAINQNLVLSDIDCTPGSPNWAKIMSSKLQNHCEIVLGYGAYKKSKGFLNKFIRFETLMTAIQMMSYAKAGMAYMGVGRNLAYKKSLFNQVGGMTSHEHIPSGDDDLFIRDAAKANNACISLDKESFTYSEPATSWKNFFDQKARHITTSTSYKFIHKFFLGIYAAAYIGFYACIICLSFCGNFAFIFEGYLLFILISMVIFTLLSDKFEERDLAVWFPILDLVFFFYLIFLSPFLLIRKQTW